MERPRIENFLDLTLKFRLRPGQPPKAIAGSSQRKQGKKKAHVGGPPLLILPFSAFSIKELSRYYSSLIMASVVKKIVLIGLLLVGCQKKEVKDAPRSIYDQPVFAEVSLLAAREDEAFAQ